MISSRSRKTIGIFLLIFLAVSILQLTKLQVYFLYSQGILYACLICAWGFLVQIRIMDRRCRNLLMGIAVCLICFFALRIARFMLYDDSVTIRRYLWYLYYVPMTCLPLLAFFVSRCILTRKERPLKGWIWLVLPLVLLNIGILTNDLHQLAFYFTDGLNHMNPPYVHRILYFLVVIWAVLLTAAMLAGIFRKCRLPQCRSMIWVPLLPLLLGSFYLILYFLGIEPRVGGRPIFQMQEIISFMTVGTLEACIQIGLLPGNGGYDTIFANASVSARIVGGKGGREYVSGKGEKIPPERFEEARQRPVLLNPGTRLTCHRIRGGELFYAEDVSSINRIHAQLEEAAEILEGENALIEAENHLREEQIRYRTQNRLYDEIARSVNGKVAQTSALLLEKTDSPALERENLARAALLTVYIKRRSNLMILFSENGQAEMKEIYLSMAESLGILQLLKTEIYLEEVMPEERIREETGLALYDFFEACLEASFGQVQSRMITFGITPEEIRFRMVMDGCGGFELPKTERSEVYADEDSVTVTAYFERGDGSCVC